MNELINFLRCTQLRKSLLFLIAFCFANCVSFAQQIWSLKKCIDYARNNNISVKQQEVQVRISELTLKQSKLLHYPTLGFSTSGGYQFGRSVDPTTNLFTTSEVGYVSTTLQTGINLFNWFTINNTIEANKYANLVDKAVADKIRNDVSLNVLAAYLQVLQSIEQEELAKLELGQTREQLATTRRRVDVGSLPELNIVEIESQFATDSAALVVVKSNRELNLLQLKALLALDAATPFEIDTATLEKLPILPLTELEPAIVFAEAVTLQPESIADKYKVLTAQKSTAIARAGMFPAFSVFGGLQTGYSSATSLLPKSGGINIPISYPIGSVSIGNTSYPVLTSSSISPVENATLFRQLDFNLRQYIGLSLNVPLFNSGQAKTAWQKAKLNEKTVQLEMSRDTLSLKQNIYQAYQNAVAAIQTFSARQKAADLSKHAYELGKKRYNNGLLPIFELITLQNNALKDKISQLASQFDYIFKMKILEFYKGNGIR